MSVKIPWIEKPNIYNTTRYVKMEGGHFIEPTKNPIVRYIPRQTGSTNWILKSAIINEQVIIVCKDSRCKNDLKSKYLRMRREFYYQLTGSEPPQSDRNWPMFITVTEYETKVRGYRAPIVFDNSCFF